MEEFEPKSRLFIEKGLDLIDNRYTGTKSTTVLRHSLNSEVVKKQNLRPDTPKIDTTQIEMSEKIQLYYFETIP